MTTVMNWLNNNRAVYFGNATSMRDFRIQLRGNRSALLFGAYLIILIGVAMFVYDQAGGDQRMSVVDAQQHLQTFYAVVMYLLAGMICLVAPALSATTVVMEKQRRSLDLVFSAPVSPKYYLVGKMLSSYRYIWMMLVLSLPITAACVVMGGASWGDVLGSYLLLSLQALVLTSFSLLMSTVAPKPVSAVLWSYAICIPYLFVTSAGAASMLFGYSHGHTLEEPFFVALSPFLVINAIGTYTVIGSTEVPNWIPAIFATLMISKIALLSAGSILNPTGNEAKSLRIHVLIYAAAVLGSLGYFSHSIGGGFDADAGGSLGREYCWVLLPLIAVLPFMTCYGFDGENRFKPDGFFKIKDMFRPSPATALPFLWTFLLVSAGSLFIGFNLDSSSSISTTTMIYSGGSTSPMPLPHPVGMFSFLGFVLFAGAFWTFFWSVGRLTSALTLGLRAARAMQFAAFVLVVAMPVPLLTTLDHSSSFTGGANIWSLWVMRSLFSSDAEATSEAMIYTAILLLMAIPISIYAETKLKEQLEKRGDARSEVGQAA